MYFHPMFWERFLVYFIMPNHASPRLLSAVGGSSELSESEEFREAENISWLFQPYLSHEKKPALLSIESWLVNRDPYSGLL